MKRTVFVFCFLSIFLSVLLTLLVVTPAASQVAVDTVFVTVEGPLFSTTITTVERKLQLGDTVQFVAVAQDEDGDSVTAQFTWASSDPSVVNIDPITGIAIAVRKSSVVDGTPVGVAISVLTEQVGELVMASFRGGQLNFSGYDTLHITYEPSPGDTAYWEGNDSVPARSLPDTVKVFPTLQYCAFLLSPTGFLVAEDPGPPTCPVGPFTPQPLYSYALFANVPRIRPLFKVRQGSG